MRDNKQDWSSNNNVNTNTEQERQFAAKISFDYENAKATRSGDCTNDIKSLEDTWEDEYFIRKGGGLQWNTSIAYRNPNTKKFRPNSEDNFVFNATEQITSNTTASTPQVTVEGVGYNDDNISQEITFMSRFNDERNKFWITWQKMVNDFINYGPVIGMVDWDPMWLGGAGPNRWIGDVRICRVRKEDFFPDPAILDLQTDLQDGSQHIRRIRKKVQWIKDRWKDKAASVSETMNDSELIDEGSDPKQTDLVEYWHRGKPEYMPKERTKELKDKANMFKEDGDEYRYVDYMDMSKGDLDGIHVAYYADGILLEYIPYVFEHGQYPFVFRVRYLDENSTWGFGEIRNIKIPQIMHNKADEIEIEAYSRQGLGGSYYEEGSVTQKQLEEIKKSSGKGGVWLAVKNIFKIKEREPVQASAGLVQYKEHKQRMVETISQNTPIQQGMAPRSNMPYKAIAELGARTDIRMKKAVDILEDFLKEINKLRISLFAQYYTEDRYYRVKGQDNQIQEGTLNRSKMMLTWIREEASIHPGTLEQTPEKKEYFIPEFDISVKIIDERPKDRNYWTQTAFSLQAIQGLTMEDLWYTLEEGKLPPREEALKRLAVQNDLLAIQQQVEALPPEGQQAFATLQQQALQQVTQAVQINQAMEEQQGKGGGMPQQMNGQMNI
jgi:hypothetical protein